MFIVNMLFYILDSCIMLFTLQVLKALLDKGTDPNKILSDGNPAIFTAVEKEYPDMLKILIEGQLFNSLIHKIYIFNPYPAGTESD